MIRRDVEDFDGTRADDEVGAGAEPAAAPNDDGGETGLQVVGQLIFQILIGLAIVAAAGAATWFLVRMKTAPSQVNEERAAPSVVVREVTIADVPTRVEGYGTVRATRQLQLFPQVSGRVIEMHPQLMTGGVLPAGAVALRIDPTDYELALEQAEANRARADAGLKRIESRRRSARAEVARQQTALQTVQAESAVARREFERINPGEPVPPLVAREPQVAEAQAGLAAAEAALEDVDAEEEELKAQQRQAASSVRQAQVQLARTSVRLPEGDSVWRVTSESVDVGQSVAPGVALASLFDARSLEVPVPLEDRQLQWIDIGGDGQGSPATISTEFGGAERSWRGRVTRTEGRIDPRTRLLDVIVTAEAPASRAGEIGLIPGLFVDVVIEGEVIEDVATLPRRALHPSEEDGAFVVHLARTGVLEIKPVEVVRQAGDVVQVRGLSEGDAVILTRMDVAAPSMPVQVGATDDAAGR